jgi:membrane protease subunit HflK
MPWSNNSGGPWGGGPSGGNNGGKNPWGNPPPGGGNGGGRGPGGGGGGGGGPQPPNLDELFRQSQERLRRTFGGGPGGGLGGGGVSKAGLLVGGLIAVGLYAYLSFYQVGAGAQGVVLRFGEYSSTQGSGGHFRVWPIDTVEIVPVEAINQTNVGFTGNGRTIPSESLMLAGDENIIDIHFSVFWRINDPKAFLFNIDDPAETVKAVAESAMREVVGRPLSSAAAFAAANKAKAEAEAAAAAAAEATEDGDTAAAAEIVATVPVAIRATRSEEIRGAGRQQVMDDVRLLIQETLDSYESGVTITDVKLDKADPPPDVIDDFRDVQAAQQDQDRLRNEADKYFNQKVAGARGAAAEMLEQAEGYRARVVAEASGQAARFESIYEQYDASDEARAIIRKRLYLETMERVFGGMNKIILDQNEAGSGGVVPYLPLNQLQDSSQRSPATPAQPGIRRIDQ